MEDSAVEVMGGGFNPIAFGASALGGILDYKSASKNRDAQRDFAQQGIRWRAEDARQAGLHPLFAMGAQLPSFTPVTTNFQEGASNIAASFRGSTNAERATHAANLEVMRSQTARNDAEAAFFASRIAMNGQEDRAAKAFPISATANPESHALYADALTLKPDEMVSRNLFEPGQTAGVDHPGMREFLMPGGMRALLPNTGSQGGMPEDIDLSLIPFVIGANIEKYGARWLVDLIGYATGRSPDTRRNQPNLERWLRKGRASNARGGPRFPGRESGSFGISP